MVTARSVIYYYQQTKMSCIIIELINTLIHSREIDNLTLNLSCKNECNFTIILCHVISDLYNSTFAIMFHVHFCAFSNVSTH